MGKKIVLSVVVFFLLVLAMVIVKSKAVYRNQFFQEKAMMMEEMKKNGMAMMPANNNMMAAPKLFGTTWVWTSTVGEDEEMTKPKQAGAFKVMFGADGNVSAMTDCNSFSGSYALMGDKLMFGEMMGTKKFCEGSQEEDFTKAVLGSESYKLENGTLVLMMKGDAGMVYFSPMAEVVEPTM